jgi:chitin disaccharide deacetylase
MTAPPRRRPRRLLVVADDFGIGPATSHGILELARQGLVSATVLLVNSPHAEAAVRAWRLAGNPLDLGWHPCLTLDTPVLPPRRVPSLVDRDGRFLPLSRFLLRLALRLVQPGELRAELRAQFVRFRDLVGAGPALVNAHHHVHVLPPVGAALRDVLSPFRPRPFLRRVLEPWLLLQDVPGARARRALLTLLGHWEAIRQRRAGFPGADCLLGITDLPQLRDPLFWQRWLDAAPGRWVELVCHPGRRDEALLGRDATHTDGHLERRARELELLQHPWFLKAADRNGFAIVRPSVLLGIPHRRAA